MIARISIGLVALASALCLTGVRAAEPGFEAGEEQTVEELRVPVQVARDRAKLMHSIYSTTLEVLHHRYFHGDRAMVPARAMEDVFSQLDQQLKVGTRWISVNTKAMSIDHEPKSDFDKIAAKEIAAGKSEFELLENGYLHRATPIPLTAGCVSCHTGFFRNSPTSPRFAGLVISVPIKLEPPAGK
jgi:hypothetical protein